MTVMICSRLPELEQGRRLYLLSWAAYAAAYVGRYNYSAVMGAITTEGILSLPTAGAVSTGYFICYALGQILCGGLSQCLSPYRMIPAGLVLSGLCNLGMGALPGKAMLAIWAVNGLCQAMIWPPIVRLFAESMPLEQQRAACVNVNSTTPAGTLAAYLVSAALLALAGWRQVFFACGGLLLAMALIWCLGTVPLRRATVMQPAPKPEKRERGSFPVLAAALGAGLIWLAIPAMLHGGLKDSVTSWVPSMIQTNFGVSPSFSAAVSAVLPLVNLSGAYTAGWLDRNVFHNELKTSASLFAAAVVCLAVLPLAVAHSLAVSVILLSLVTASMLGINTMFINVMPVRAGRKGGAAVLSGTLNAVTYLGAAAATWGIGSAAGVWGWSAAFALWLIMAVLGLAVSAVTAGRWAWFAAEQEESE